jgi:cytochrome c553
MRCWRLATVVAVLLGAGPTVLRAQTVAERLPTCLACHGEKGQSDTAEVPSLGAQPSPYVLIELYMFREKLRVGAPMNDMAAGLSDPDLQTLADTIAKLPAPKPADGGDPARMARGQALVDQNRCNFCHQTNFTGNENVPRLAGQREDYILKSLREYKGHKRKEYQPAMGEVVGPLKDEDFVELAYYISHFK